MLKRLYNWMGTQVYSPYAVSMLAVLFFIEAIFFVPVDPLLVLFCVERPNKAFFYAWVATIASSIGGVAAYFIGYAVWETIGMKLVLAITSLDTFNYLCDQYRLYESWAVLLAGFTPIPYKAVTLTAGFCKLPLLPFIICSFLARGARFFLVALVISIWGVQIKEYIDHWFNLLVLLFLALVAGSIWIFR